MTDELKRCPFCGGEGVEYGLSNGAAYIECQDCEIRQDVQACGDVATKVWNTRPAEDELHAKIAQLQEQGDKLAEEVSRLLEFMDEAPFDLRNGNVASGVDEGESYGTRVLGCLITSASKALTEWRGEE